MNIFLYKLNYFLGRKAKPLALEELEETTSTRAAKPTSISYNSKQVWYGRVNDWKNMSVTRKDIEACVKYKVNGYMIEMSGDIPGSSTYKNFWKDAWIKNIETCYKELVKRTRAAGMWLFVSIVNDNIGSGKYGQTGPKLDKVMNQAKKLVAIIKKYGSTGVLVQPVAETQTAAGRSFDNYCKTQLKGFNLVYNGSGGRPSNLGGMKFRAYHPASIETKVPKDAFAISDHGKIIRELSVKSGDPKKYDYSILKKSDTWPSSPVNKSKLEAWAKNIFTKCGCRVLGIYAFQRIAHDGSTIKYLGSLKRK